MGAYLAKTYTDYYKSSELQKHKERLAVELAKGDYIEAVWTRTAPVVDDKILCHVESYKVSPVETLVNKPIVVKATDRVCEFLEYGSEGSYIITLEQSINGADFEFSSLAVCNGASGRPGLISNKGTIDKTKPDETVIYRFTLWSSIEDTTPVDPSKIVMNIYIIQY